MSCSITISNVTGHDCAYEVCNNWFYEYRSYCTYSEFTMHWLSYAIIFVFVFWFVYQINKWISIHRTVSQDDKKRKVKA